MVRRSLKTAAVLGLAALAVIQFIQPRRVNPPSDPAADFQAVADPRPAVSAVVDRACRDCHSNTTAWPWYSRVAPVSWLVASDVSEGRARLNFSEWNRYSAEVSARRLAAACEEVRKGEMPPWYYRPAHPKSKLTAEDVSAFCAVSGPAPLSN